MRIKIWGSRGSLPAPLTPAAVEGQVRELFHQFFAEGHRSRAEIEPFLNQIPRYRFGGYGGNTPCVQVSTPAQTMIIDGGSGIRLAGYELMNGACGKGQGEIHIFFTHFHWDHLIGLPFFTPIFVPGNKIHVYSVQPELEEVFRTLFRKPYFPVPFERLGATIEFHRLEPRKTFALGDLEITPYQLDHPDPCWGYRVASGGKVFAHCVDTEGLRATPEELGPDLPLYQGVDLMLFDGQYTLMESIEKVNWGHSSALIGLDLAIREGIRRVLFMHHDPASSNEKIADAHAQAERYYKSQIQDLKKAGSPFYEVEWGFAYEGQIIEV